MNSHEKAQADGPRIIARIAITICDKNYNPPPPHPFLTRVRCVLVKEIFSELETGHPESSVNEIGKLSVLRDGFICFTP